MVDITLRGKLSAQVYAGTIRGGEGSIYTHIITLRGEEHLVILQLPCDRVEPFTIEEFRAHLVSIMDGDLPMYPCVGSGFGISVEEDDFSLVTSYSSQGMNIVEFHPTSFRDKVI